MTTSIITQDMITMNSREIAEMVDSRHDHVKTSIERLAKTTYSEDGIVKRKAVIGIPAMEEYLDTLGRKATQYRICKRDTFIIVAQLCPEFTARLVDRWQELEARQYPALPDFTNQLSPRAHGLIR